jgi:thioredoxin
MNKRSGHYNFHIRLLVAVFTTFFFLGIVSCKNDTSKQAQAPVDKSIINSIEDANQFNKILETSKERLLLLDFYADWCPPCKELAPILEKIAKEKSATVTIYKIDIDRNRELSNSFRITGIPHVAFFKNKENVFSLTGLYPKDMYLKVIEKFAETGTS